MTSARPRSSLLFSRVLVMLWVASEPAIYLCIGTLCSAGGATARGDFRYVKDTRTIWAILENRADQVPDRPGRYPTVGRVHRPD